MSDGAGIVPMVATVPRRSDRPFDRKRNSGAEWPWPAVCSAPELWLSLTIPRIVTGFTWRWPSVSGSARPFLGRALRKDCTRRSSRVITWPRRLPPQHDHTRNTRPFLPAYLTAAVALGWRADYSVCCVCFARWPVSAVSAVAGALCERKCRALIAHSLKALC